MFTTKQPLAVAPSLFLPMQSFAFSELARISQLLDLRLSAKWIAASSADSTKKQQKSLFQNKIIIKKSDKFILLGKLDGFYLTEYSDYLRELIKIGLILSPSNSRVKCVFLINDIILETNLKNVSVELFICIENCL